MKQILIEQAENGATQINMNNVQGAGEAIIMLTGAIAAITKRDLMTPPPAAAVTEHTSADMPPPPNINGRRRF